jgi:hypothetical protein
MSFCEKLCVRLGNTNSAIFDILPDSFGKPSDKTEDVCSDLNVTNYEEVSTSEIITFESDSFLSMLEIIMSGNIDDKTEHLLEIKCPYKWRNSTVEEACKSSYFYCYLDKNNSVTLKRNSRYFTQVQGQMAVCKYSKCEFVVYTLKRHESN